MWPYICCCVGSGVIRGRKEQMSGFFLLEAISIISLLLPCWIGRCHFTLSLFRVELQFNDHGEVLTLNRVPAGVKGWHTCFNSHLGLGAWVRVIYFVFHGMGWELWGSQDISWNWATCWMILASGGLRPISPHQETFAGKGGKVGLLGDTEEEGENSTGRHILQGGMGSLQPAVLEQQSEHAQLWQQQTDLFMACSWQ